MKNMEKNYVAVIKRKDDSTYEVEGTGTDVMAFHKEVWFSKSFVDRSNDEDIIQIYNESGDLVYDLKRGWISYE